MDRALENAGQNIAAIMNRTRGESVHALAGELKGTMERYGGIFRDKENLEKGIEAIQSLASRYRQVSLTDRSDAFNTELVAVLELGHMIDIAQTILTSALIARREPRLSLQDRLPRA